ncbi:MAG: dephospho-CoA kinase [Chromatiaceae bacterium]|nr:dephospho-CoA kinase [Chromatiaceae bacterium]MCP5443059.1 dephospho-CoA kinase [Chromatiaceae bacterium]
MLVVGLTGGIGCGKSAVTDLFERLGVPVIDADKVARELVWPGQPALAQIVRRFGNHVLAADGSLDRAQLREIVFNDAQAREDLESILHPLIRRTMRQRLEVIHAPYAILSIPLLQETGQTAGVDRVLVVDCKEEVQIERVSRRDRTGPERVRAILAAQSSRESKLQIADDVIENSGPLEALEPQVEALHHRYLAQSGLCQQKN